MSRNRDTAPTFNDGTLREEGEVVDNAGEPGSTLAPHDAARRPAVKAKRTVDAREWAALSAREGRPSRAFFSNWPSDA